MATTDCLILICEEETHAQLVRLLTILIVHQVLGDNSPCNNTYPKQTRIDRQLVCVRTIISESRHNIHHAACVLDGSIRPLVVLFEMLLWLAPFVVYAGGGGGGGNGRKKRESARRDGEQE